jgi:AraC-like DNA-binding protein
MQMLRHEYLLKAKTMIDRRYREEIDVVTVANEIGLSREHLSREFHRAFGMPPHQYLRRRRLERAAADLRHTDLAISAICRRVGLGSPTSFATSFGEAYGCTPSAYRTIARRGRKAGAAGVTMNAAGASLARVGFTTLAGPHLSAEEAFAAAAAVFAEAFEEPERPSLEVIGDFTIPPPDRPPSRGFQTLHIDCTALYLPSKGRAAGAATRLVPLAQLLAQRSWPDPDELRARLIAYGRSHGGRDGARGYVEGSFARIVEAVDGRPPRLSSVRANPDLLCGAEFGDLGSEVEFFHELGLSIEEAQWLVGLEPGEVLLFDNLALAHGRVGRRDPGRGALRQRVFGYPDLDVDGQRRVRDRTLGLFSNDRGR